MATLTNCNINFHTNNDDKDNDTLVTVTVHDANNVVAARVSNDFGHFDDNSDAGPFALAVQHRSAKADLQRGKVTIRIDPNGHDTWRFNFFLDLLFSDGSHLSGGANGLELNQDQREQSFGLDGMLSPIAPPTDSEIAVAAYLNWCGRGRSDGNDWADWFAAKAALFGNLIKR